MKPTIRHLLAITTLVGLGSACTYPVELYCDESTPCTNLNRPFCDLTGEYPASEGIGRTCIPDPRPADASVPDGRVSVADASVADASVADASVADASVADASAPDASAADGSPPDAGSTTTCNPVTNTGCDPTEKCTMLTDPSSGLTMTGCAPNGTVDLGGTCTQVAGQSYDDCKAKSLCSGGTCREICDSATNSCNATQCTQYVSVFDDVPDTGLCPAPCDPVAQDCADVAQGCFVLLNTGFATCEGANAAGTAGVECSGPSSSPTSCWTNGCAKGHVAFLNATTAGGRPLCTPFCTPIDADSTNWQVNRMGNPTGVTCPTVGWANGVLPGNISCRYLGAMYANVKADPTVGVCVDFTAEFATSSMPIGSCENQTPGANDPGNVPTNATWVPGCLAPPAAAAASRFDRSNLPGGAPPLLTRPPRHQ